MEYRQLGKTGMKLSSLSFGSSSLGGVFHDLEEKEGIRAVHTAVEMGINFIDVAPYYGFYKAETLLGKALQNINRENYYLSTKVGRYGEKGIKTWDYSADRAIRSVDESLGRLHIDYIDIINVHDIEFSNPEQVINETIPALIRLKEIGKVKHIGITGLPLTQLRYLVEHVPAGTIDSVLSFCHYCLNDDSLSDYFSFFESHGVGIINASPLAMGLLTERGTPQWHPASKKLKDHCLNAAGYCRSKNYSIEQLAVKYSVSNARITTTLIGTTSPENIRKNILWAESPQHEELLKEVLNLLKPVHRETWENS